jgi:hypothetical protein
MKHQESTAYKPLPYLANDVGVTHKDREALLQWGFRILDACKVDRHFAIVAVSFLDRFLSCRGLRSVEACLARQREFQLAYTVSSSDQLCASLLLLLTSPARLHQIDMPDPRPEIPRMHERDSNIRGGNNV